MLPASPCPSPNAVEPECNHNSRMPALSSPSPDIAEPVCNYKSIMSASPCTSPDAAEPECDHNSRMSDLSCAWPDKTESDWDPLVTARRHNIEKSQLYRLPDDVLIKVFAPLDTCGVECFRRVSRRLGYICDNAQLKHLTQPPEYYNKRPPGRIQFVWPRTTWTACSRISFLRLLNKDRYCNGCQKARNAPDWWKRVDRLHEYLRCSGCRARHPACQFSKDQRTSRQDRT